MRKRPYWQNARDNRLGVESLNQLGHHPETRAILGNWDSLLRKGWDNSRDPVLEHTVRPLVFKASEKRQGRPK